MESWLVGLLRAGWLAGTLPLIIASLPSSRFNTLHGALLGFAKRGKIMHSSSHKFTVPQKFFCHFYVVAVVWTTFLLFSTWAYAHKMAPSVSELSLHSTIASHLTGDSHVFSFDKSRSTPLQHRYGIWSSVFLLLLMETQVLRRLIETINTFKYSPSARMHIFGYITGLFFYAAAPLSLCCTLAPWVFRFAADDVAEFIIVKGWRQTPSFEFDWWESLNPLLKLGWYQWIGATIFFWGWVHQRRCHAILGALRKDAERVGEYFIPHGDWFEIVSSPHYLAEIVIYAGLLVASGGADLTIWFLFAFVVANLVFAAAETHRWYLAKFDNYPSDRYAIIPYVY